jgi:hypothetical protein
MVNMVYSFGELNFKNHYHFCHWFQNNLNAKHINIDKAQFPLSSCMKSQTQNIKHFHKAVALMQQLYDGLTHENFNCPYS